MESLGTGIAGKTALITGAAKRLGRAICLALAQEGVNVIVHYNRSSREAVDLCHTIRAKGVSAWPIKADFSQPEECTALIERAYDLAGPFQFLVNSAAIFSPSTLMDFSLEDAQMNLQVNAWAPLLLSRAFVKRMKRGQIINFLDSKIAVSSCNHVAYYLSKQMLSILTRLMAMEWAPEVLVNAIAPGLILPPEGKAREDFKPLETTVPLRKIGDPKDIVEAVLFLLKSHYITGQTIYVDGGWRLRAQSAPL